MNEKAVFLSINRFERKKNIGLAIKALSALHQELQKIGTVKDELPGLVVAGGYDVRLAENVEHLQELECLVEELGLREYVVFMPSFTDEQRLALLVACQAVIYTPENEHFGIVPIESMATGTPVIACNSGGPKESIETGQTGYLVEPNPDSCAGAMEKCLDAEQVSKLGKNARKRTLDKFSRTSFGSTLDAIIQTLVVRQKSK
jgi:alpha-1,3/alpha-1,6-mannosyltransferase